MNSEHCETESVGLLKAARLKMNLIIKVMKKNFVGNFGRNLEKK
jgi:hypothetical protein